VAVAAGYSGCFNMDNLALRFDIQNLENTISSTEGAFFGDSDNCPLKHSFAEGCYVREIFIPAGTVVVGKIHRHSHPNFLMSGEVIVVTEEGRKRLKAPMAMISEKGTKRAVYAITDAVWATVHVTDETDLSKIEEEVIAKDFRSIGLEDPMLNKIEAQQEGAIKCLG